MSVAARPYRLAGKPHVVEHQATGGGAPLETVEQRQERRRRLLLLGGVLGQVGQPVGEHHPVHVPVVEGEAAVRPPLRDPVGDRVIGHGRSVEGDAEAAERLAQQLQDQLVHAAEVGVHGHRGRAHVGGEAAGGDGGPALLGEHLGGGGQQLGRDLGITRPGHLTSIHDIVIHNSVIEREEMLMSMVETSKWLTGLYAPLGGGGDGVRSGGRGPAAR